MEEDEQSRRAPFSWREAREEDMAAVTAIFNQVLRDSNSIYQEHEVSLDSRVQVLRDRLANGFPFIVAVEPKSSGEGEEVVGYASYGPFRTSYGYRFTAEHSIHVREDKRGKGLGKHLLTKLLEIAVSKGVHVMVAAIDSGNEMSILMHRKFGFEEVGRMPEVGCKRGQWLTLVLMQKILS